MDHIHGLDVSWMATSHVKDKTVRNQPPVPGPATAPDPASPAAAAVNFSHAEPPKPPLLRTSSAKNPADDKKLAVPAPSPPQRRNSWFSSISSKFTSGGGAADRSPAQTNTTSPKPAELSVPRATPAKNAVLQHATRSDGDAPYTPAPPKSSPTGLLQVLRRLSSSNGALSPAPKVHNHGLVERRILNVNQHRERCRVDGLSQAKLRRVAFCVDVEIAPMPKYLDDKKTKGKDKKKKSKERSDGGFLKQDGTGTIGGEDATKEAPESPSVGELKATAAGRPMSASEKKKEKKKKSEEERKARKEKRRRQAEANGTIPMELHYDSDSTSSGTTPRPDTPSRSKSLPTTNPVRIYRRCCQLRETPILRKITEQLTDPANCSATDPSVVEKLDLTGYWMQLTDLVTLGDYLAVVPVREVILDGCGLTDEGVRVVLAGLLAVRRNRVPRRRRPTISTGAGAGAFVVAGASAGVSGGSISSSNGASTGSSSNTGPATAPAASVPSPEQGGVVERLVLRNNKLGVEGWKHICLFVHMCRSVKSLDLSGIPFPRQAIPPPTLVFDVAPGTPTLAPNAPSQQQQPQSHSQLQSVAQLLSRSLAERLGGSTLSMLMLNQTEMTAEQLGCVVDGAIRCGVKRLGLAGNELDAAGLAHVARFLRTGFCEGLDLAGNDLREGVTTLAEALSSSGAKCPLTTLTLADCQLTPPALCKLLPALVRLEDFRFLDLSRNRGLFESDPSAVCVLRRYLPKMACLKRIHLADCAMSPEQVMAIAEILPEVPGLAHVSFLENPQLVELATNATTGETQEEACALFASLLAAARVSTSLVAIDIEVPSEQSSDLVKALAKQVVAYCLRNMEVATAATTAAEAEVAKLEPQYPHALQRLVGHDVTSATDLDADVDAAPDEDYVIGGTGVVRALACCLKNRGEDDAEGGRPSGEFMRDVENGAAPTPIAGGSGGGGGGGAKAKETSKHLLLSARKIRLRLQPAIDKARATASDSHNYYRLMFLSNTLEGIIRRFEDEFPDTRLSPAPDSAIDLPKDGVDGSRDKTDANSSQPNPSDPTTATAVNGTTANPAASDNDPDPDEPDGATIRPPALSRSNSLMSLSSKALAHEEGRVLRAGHAFRAGVAVAGDSTDDSTTPTQQSQDGGDNASSGGGGKTQPGPEHYALLASGVEMVGADPNHARLLHELLEELGGEEGQCWYDAKRRAEVAEKGVVAVFKEHRAEISARLREADPVHWRGFVESQEMARMNVSVRLGEEGESKVENGVDAGELTDGGIGASANAGEVEEKGGVGAS
ncbi:hypothetical protein VTJ49DRAFT_5943 [Mycothermus thermophilus]|uniref:RNI-like protein n=1 Tax=Humicola insolens TaxID=85995 RepID=A0ABR3VLA6_HUMIN